jgi:hypothetical protein
MGTPSNPNLVKDPQSLLTVNYSLIDERLPEGVAGIGIITATPQLGPLADNGGPTRTHALLTGSPAIDAGDPSIVFNPTQFDARGALFVRVIDGDGSGGARIDATVNLTVLPVN